MAERIKLIVPRPRKGDPKHQRRVRTLQDKIVASVRAFMPFSHACALHGVNSNTAEKWKRFGDNYSRAMEDEEEDHKHEIHYHFMLNLKRARAEVQEEIIERSFRSNKLNPGWVRDITFLSRRDPMHWSTQNRREAQQDNEASGDQWDPDESFL